MPIKLCSSISTVRRTVEQSLLQLQFLARKNGHRASTAGHNLTKDFHNDQSSAAIQHVPAIIIKFSIHVYFAGGRPTLHLITLINIKYLCFRYSADLMHFTIQSAKLPASPTIIGRRHIKTLLWQLKSHCVYGLEKVQCWSASDIITVIW